MRTITVVYNSKAGGGYQLDVLRQAFEKSKLAAGFVTLSDTQKVDHKTEVLVAAGGDGTVNAVAKLAIEINIPMAVLPAGTLNHFAKDMGIPTDLDEAVAVISTGEERRVDVASVNGHIFLNNSSIGLYPEIVRQREGRYGWLSKWPAAAISFISVTSHLRSHQLQIRIDGRPALQRTTPFVFIGNNSYGIDQMGVSNRDKLDGGIMCLYLVRAHTLPALLRITWRSLWGRVRQEDDLEIFTGTSIEINSSRPLSVAYDGEVTKLGSPLNYQIEAKRLKVTAP